MVKEVINHMIYKNTKYKAYHTDEIGPKSNRNQAKTHIYMTIISSIGTGISIKSGGEYLMSGPRSPPPPLILNGAIIHRVNKILPLVN